MIGIRIYNGDVRFTSRGRPVDFLVDHITIKPSDVLFIAESGIDGRYKEELTKRGYQYIELRTVPIRHPRSREVLKALAKVRGSESGYAYAEAFMIHKTYG